jgi:hypothetical protein
MQLRVHAGGRAASLRRPEFCCTLSTAAPRPSSARRRGSVIVAAQKSSRREKTTLSPGDAAPAPLTTETPASSSSTEPDLGPKDFWEGEQWDTLGTVVSYGVLIVAVLGGTSRFLCPRCARSARDAFCSLRPCAAVAGFVATSTYNDGAVGVDFTDAPSPQEAVQKAIAAAAQAPPPTK